MKKTRMIRHLILMVIVFLSASCATTHEILLGDVISFGDDAITSYKCRKGKMKNLYKQGEPYVLYLPSKNADLSEQLHIRGLVENNKNAMRNQIDNTQMENNTAGIYAMDIALDRIKYIRKHQLKGDRNAKYYIIYMTDGLDNISVQVAKNNKQGSYKTPDKYKKKMEKKIKKVSKCKKKDPNQFDIYPVVFTGTDLGAVKKDNKMSDAQFRDFINRNMGWMRGSSRGKNEAPEIIQASDFGIVLEKFKEEFNASGFEFYVPKGYEGKKIRMSFSDGMKRTELEGRFIRKGGKYFLKDIELRNGLRSGITLKKGKKLEFAAINYKDKKAELAEFRFEKPKYKDSSYFIESDSVEQFVKDEDFWVKNSEYTSQSKGAIDTYFILVFDASKSLGDEKFPEERETAMKMIGIITRDVMNAEKKVDKVGDTKK